MHRDDSVPANTSLGSLANAMVASRQSLFESSRTCEGAGVGGASGAGARGRTLSRVQQNLSWLPVNMEPEPLSAPLPGCPPLMDQDSELRNRYLAYVTHAQEIGPQRMTEADRERGRLLARDCHSRAIDLVHRDLLVHAVCGHHGVVCGRGNFAGVHRIPKGRGSLQGLAAGQRTGSGLRSVRGIVYRQASIGQCFAAQSGHVLTVLCRLQILRASLQSS